MAQTLTFLDLQDRVYAYLRDDDHEFVTPDNILAWVNDAQTDLASRLNVIRYTATGTTTDGEITVPDDFLKELELRLPDMGEIIEFTDEFTFDRFVDTAQTPVNVLGHISPGSDVITLYPAPDDGTDYILKYSALPGEIVDDTDTSELPPTWHVRLTYYALANAAMKMNDPTGHDRWLARYEDGLVSLPTGAAKYDEGAWGFSPYLGPFDEMDGDDGPIHQ